MTILEMANGILNGEGPIVLSLDDMTALAVALIECQRERKKLLDELMDMVYQYLSAGFGRYSHDFIEFMSPGEGALALLRDMGLMKSDDGVYYTVDEVALKAAGVKSYDE